MGCGLTGSLGPLGPFLLQHLFARCPVLVAARGALLRHVGRGVFVWCTGLYRVRRASVVASLGFGPGVKPTPLHRGGWSLNPLANREALEF